MPRIHTNNSKRTYVTLVDARTKKSQSFTIRDVTPNEAAKIIKEAVHRSEEEQKTTAA